MANAKATPVAPKEETAPTVVEEKTTAITTAHEAPMGFEDESSDDLIVPRVKIIQTLSPERKEKLAEEGDIINSLTKDNYNGKVFVPVFKFSNNIWWKDRSDGGGINCIARDGKRGETSGGKFLICASCKRNEFDNTKQGKESHPSCTKYINFFGFFEGERMPIIMSFAKTNYAEGKKLYSLAKVTMQNMWNYGYTLTPKLQAKGGNEWFIISTSPNGATSDEDRAFALTLYHSFKDTIQNVKYDVEETSSGVAEASPNVADTEY